MANFKEILIKKEQFVPIMKMFLEDIVEPQLLKLFSQRRFYNYNEEFFLKKITLNRILESRINKDTNEIMLLPLFDIYYVGFVGDNKIVIAEYVKKQIDKYFDNLIIDLPDSFEFTGV